MVKNAFIATNFVIVPITSHLRVPGHGSLGIGSQCLGSQASDPGSQIVILDYAHQIPIILSWH